MKVDLAKVPTAELRYGFMRAIVYRSYGSPDVLQCENVEKPAPGDEEVLVRIRAASVNPMDYHLMGGLYLARLARGIRKPKPSYPGVDLAGEVEAIGRSVTRFQPGDAVFGVGRRAFAEYVCTSQNRLARKPANITFEQAAAIPVAGVTALQGLRDKGRIQPGQNVLINGAAGGVGTFAAQIAKSFGAEVTGVCSTARVDLVRSIGADHVIDYNRDDVTSGARRYDLILDCVGNRPLSAWRRVMTTKGTFVAVGARPGGHWLGPLPYLLKLLVSARFASQKVVFFIAQVTGDDLTVLKELIEANKVTPVVDRSYPLSEIVDAVRHLKQGHPRGKVVVTVAAPIR
jgi:NADPH:quinone reductase-like Zn-dependent oxidoreductase